MGILNIRPEGPCKNTKVDLDKVTEAIHFFRREGAIEIDKSSRISNFRTCENPGGFL